MNMKFMNMYSSQFLVGLPLVRIAAVLECKKELISLWFCPGVARAQVALIVKCNSSAYLGLEYLIFLSQNTLIDFLWGYTEMGAMTN